jgi:hypothetical protein
VVAVVAPVAPVLAHRGDEVAVTAAGAVIGLGAEPILVHKREDGAARPPPEGPVGERAGHQFLPP